MDGIHCTLTKSVSELNVAFGMSTLEDDELERELVVVGRELAHVNKKLCTQLKAMQALLREYEASVVVEEMLDCIGYPFSLGSSRMDPVKTLHPTQPTISPSPSQPIVGEADVMTGLQSAIAPLLDYETFSWRNDEIVPKNCKRPRHDYTHTNLLHKQTGFHHVPVAVLAGKEVDMPYVLWENLHRVIVRTGKELFLKTTTQCCIPSTDQWKPNFVQSPNAAQTSHTRPHMSPSFLNNASPWDSDFQWLGAHNVVFMHAGHELFCWPPEVVHTRWPPNISLISIYSMDMSQ